MTGRRRFLRASLAAAIGEAALPEAWAIVEGEPSRTARGAAMQRAAHQLLEVPRVFEDPLALRIFGDEGARWLTANLDRYRTEESRAMRAFLVARSRFAEDELARSVAGGTSQYIVLGAGLDTFGCRNPHAGLKVFEVDFPATQAWKRERLAASGIARPASLAFAAVDFEKRSLGSGLAGAGFAPAGRAFASWLGVTPYLTRAAVMETLGYVARRWARGSAIVFDFGLPDAQLSEAERGSRAAAAARVAKVGEPWITFFDPAELAGEMRAMGYSAVEVLGNDEMNRRYFAGRADGFRMVGSGRLALARV